MSSSRPTIADIARAAGVGVATVDRVLNNRSSVRRETRNRVIRAARELGFIRRQPQPLELDALVAPEHRARSATGPRRLAFVLQQRNPDFYQSVTEALQLAAREIAVEMPPPKIVQVDGMQPGEVASTLLHLGQSHDAIAVVSADNPLISQAIDQLTRQGVACFALMSDLSALQRSGYVGLDNRKVGRTAAWAIASIARTPGKVGILMGHHRLLCQELCEISFRSYFREHASQFQILDPLLSLEDSERAYRTTLQLLETHPDLVGLYIDSGAVDGVFRALRETGRYQDITSVCHEFVAATRTALMEHVVQFVLAHPLQRIAREVILAMLAPLPAGLEQSPPRQCIVPFEILTPENI